MLCDDLEGLGGWDEGEDKREIDEGGEICVCVCVGALSDKRGQDEA